ncbi:hypothetical protein HMPREF9065_02080 [Aggregatibacter sp. oral taxon 458 str. W10330]|nr:hypothetical protein HMPREF9065_02080 [Aggregatibacter sp. oral taxon 458 str. W10330]
MHATYEIVNYASGLIIRATSCTLRTKSINKKRPHFSIYA